MTVLRLTATWPDFGLFALVVCGLFANQASMLADERGAGFKDEADARKLYDRMIEAMQEAETLSFLSTYQREAVGHGKTKCTYRVWLRKPNYFRVESRSVAGKVGGVLIGDGERLWLYWPNGRPRWEYVEESEVDRTTRFKSYMTKPAPLGNHSIWHEVLFLGGGMSFPVIEPSTFHGYIDPIHKHLDAVRSLGSEKAGDEECDKIEVSMLDGQRRWYLWLSKRDHLPRKLKEIVKVAYDNITQEAWSSVEINRDIPDSMFAWKPPADWVKWRLPVAEDSLLEPGASAPDFEMTSVDGKRIRLSDYRGKTVWLCFWRLGCPPCRKETPLLQDLYDKFKDKGLVVLGANVDDDRKLTIDYLRRQGVTFPSIHDTSDAAKRVCQEDYRGGGVPLNYLIDRNGRVVVAAFEYEPVRAALTNVRPDFVEPAP